MPIKIVDISQPPGLLVQVCASCGLEHAIRFNRGAVETKPEPFSLEEGATLEVNVDGNPVAPISVAKNDAKTLAATTAIELKAILGKITGVVVAVTPAATVVIESASTGAKSSVQFTGGSGRASLGEGWDTPDPCPARPVLGAGNAERSNEDLIVLRRCGCGTFDIVSRTWDLAPSNLAGSFFYEHRKAVNSLAEHFKSQGWVHPELAAKLTEGKTAPPDRFPAEAKLIAVPSAANRGRS